MKTLVVNRKIIVSIIVVMLLIYGVQDISYGQGAPGTIVEFSERSLAIMVRLSISMNSAEDFFKSPNLPELIKMPEAEVLKIHKAELKKLRTLFANKRTTDKLRLPAIVDLTGLEHASELRSIFLGGQPVIDLTPLSQLMQLTSLDFRWSKTIGDITPLAQLTELRRLNLFNNQITDIAPLAQLTQLIDLNLGRNNNISDLTPLAGLTALTELDLGGNNISDLTPLAGLTALTELDLGGNNISDLTPLAGLTALTELDLIDNNISNLTPLTQLTQLEWLFLDLNQIRNISPIAHLKQLTFLNLSYNQVRDVTPLAQLTESLIKLDLSRNQVRDVIPLGEVIYLEKLDLEKNKIIDVTPLAGLTYLEELQLEDNQITDVTPLAGLTSLRELILRDNPIKDTSPLSLLLDENPDVRIDIEVIRIDKKPVPAVGASTEAQEALTTGESDPSSTASETPVDTDTVVSISPTSVASPAVGQQLEISLKIMGGEAVAGYQATVQFDRTALRYVSAANGDYLPAGAFFVEPKVEGNLVKLNAASLAGESNGDGTLAMLTFEVIAAKVSQLTLSDVLLTDNAGSTSVPNVENTEITGPTGLKGDVNGDGQINIADLVLVASNLGKTGQNPADVNGDGQVNIADLVLVAGALGNTAAAPSLLHPDALEMLTSADVRLWLSQAQHLDLTDLTVQRGVLFLEQLLAVLIPKETALLANYPNPFNPETWIPYQLAKDANVTLHIYAVNGQLVRTLTLGHQAAGMYQSRSRAAYWDGRNAFGEHVASGVYFYTFTAGDFTATRKMLIRK